MSFTLLLRDDGVKQSVAIDADNVLHPGSDLGSVASERQISAMAIKHKDIHIAVMETLCRIRDVAQKSFARGCRGSNQTDDATHAGGYNMDALG